MSNYKIKNHRSVSLLLICVKTLKKITHNTIFKCLIKNNLFYENHCGFKPRDSCINQLLFIVHDIRQNTEIKITLCKGGSR